MIWTPYLAAEGRQSVPIPAALWPCCSSSPGSPAPSCPALCPSIPRTTRSGPWSAASCRTFLQGPAGRGSKLKFLLKNSGMFKLVEAAAGKSATWLSDVRSGVLGRWEGDEHHWDVPQHLVPAQRSILLHASQNTKNTQTFSQRKVL